MPVVETMPAGTARPKAWVAWSMSPWVQPGPDPHGPRRGIDPHPLHHGQVDHQPVVAAAEAGAVVAAAADGQQQPVVPGECTAAMTSATSAQRAMSSGRLSIMPL